MESTSQFRVTNELGPFVPSNSKYSNLINRNHPGNTPSQGGASLTGNGTTQANNQFYYPYPRTLADPKTVSKNDRTLMNALSWPATDTYLVERAIRSSNQRDKRHSVLASDMVVFYHLYAVLHAQGEPIVACTSSDVKTYDGDIYSVKVLADSYRRNAYTIRFNTLPQDLYPYTLVAACTTGHLPRGCRSFIILDTDQDIEFDDTILKPNQVIREDIKRHPYNVISLTGSRIFISRDVWTKLRAAGRHDLTAPHKHLGIHSPDDILVAMYIAQWRVPAVVKEHLWTTENLNGRLRRFTYNPNNVLFTLKGWTWSSMCLRCKYGKIFSVHDSYVSFTTHITQLTGIHYQPLAIDMTVLPILSPEDKCTARFDWLAGRQISNDPYYCGPFIFGKKGRVTFPHVLVAVTQQGTCVLVTPGFTPATIFPVIILNHDNTSHAVIAARTTDYLDPVKQQYFLTQIDLANKAILSVYSYKDTTLDQPLRIETGAFPLQESRSCCCKCRCSCKVKVEYEVVQYSLAGIVIPYSIASAYKVHDKSLETAKWRVAQIEATDQEKETAKLFFTAEQRSFMSRVALSPWNPFSCCQACSVDLNIGSNLTGDFNLEEQPQTSNTPNETQEEQQQEEETGSNGGGDSKNDDTPIPVNAQTVNTQQLSPVLPSNDPSHLRQKYSLGSALLTQSCKWFMKLACYQAPEHTYAALAQFVFNKAPELPARISGPLGKLLSAYSDKVIDLEFIRKTSGFTDAALQQAQQAVARFGSQKRPAGQRKIAESKPRGNNQHLKPSQEASLSKNASPYHAQPTVRSKNQLNKPAQSSISHQNGTQSPTTQSQISRKPSTESAPVPRPVTTQQSTTYSKAPTLKAEALQLPTLVPSITVSGEGSEKLLSVYWQGAQELVKALTTHMISTSHITSSGQMVESSPGNGSPHCLQSSSSAESKTPMQPTSTMMCQASSEQDQKSSQPSQPDCSIQPTGKPVPATTMSTVEMTTLPSSTSQSDQGSSTPSEPLDSMCALKGEEAQESIPSSQGTGLPHPCSLWDTVIQTPSRPSMDSPPSSETQVTQPLSGVETPGSLPTHNRVMATLSSDRSHPPLADATQHFNETSRSTIVNTGTAGEQTYRLSLTFEDYEREHHQIPQPDSGLQGNSQSTHKTKKNSNKRSSRSPKDESSQLGDSVRGMKSRLNAMNCSMPIIQTASSHMSTNPFLNSKTARKQAKTMAKKNAKNKANSMRLNDQIAGHRSVRRGLAAIPNTSSAYLRTVLDPAHLMDYNCVGLPDDNKFPTRVIRNMQTHGFPSSFRPIGTNSLTSDSISSVDIWLTDAPGAPLLYVAHGTQHYVARQAETALTNIVSELKADSRIIARGLTVSQIGPKAQRGGYFQCMQPTTYVTYNSTSNVNYYTLDQDNAESNPSAVLEGDSGVYCMLTPTQPQWNKAFHHLDDSEDVYVTIGHTSTRVWIGEPGFYSPPDNTPWHWNVIRYIPTTPFKIGRASTSQADFATDVDTQLWNMRLTVFTSLEYITSKNQSTDATMSDPAAIAMLYALLEHHICFYPASYNEWRKVLGAVKETYKRYKPLIDVASGYIPYGATVKQVLDKLMA